MRQITIGDVTIDSIIERDGARGGGRGGRMLLNYDAEDRARPSGDDGSVHATTPPPTGW